MPEAGSIPTTCLEDLKCAVLTYLFFEHIVHLIKMFIPLSRFNWRCEMHDATIRGDGFAIVDMAQQHGNDCI